MCKTRVGTKVVVRHVQGHDTGDSTRQLNDNETVNTQGIAKVHEQASMGAVVDTASKAKCPVSELKEETEK